MTQKNEKSTVYACIKLDYSRKLVLPLESGLALMKAFSEAKVMTEEYVNGKNRKILKDVDDILSLTLLTEQQINEYQLEAALEI